MEFVCCMSFLQLSKLEDLDVHVQLTFWTLSSAGELLHRTVFGKLHKEFECQCCVHRMLISYCNPPPPFSLFFLEMSGTEEDISQVHWKQQWLENGTLYFHVSLTESELLAQTTQSAPREPAHVLHEHMHFLHISVMVSSDNIKNHHNVSDLSGYGDLWGSSAFPALFVWDWLWVMTGGVWDQGSVMAPFLLHFCPSVPNISYATTLHTWNIILKLVILHQNTPQMNGGYTWTAPSICVPCVERKLALSGF